jgi:hypothetical protein
VKKPRTEQLGLRCRPELDFTRVLEICAPAGGIKCDAVVFSRRELDDRSECMWVRSLLPPLHLRLAPLLSHL